MTIKGGEKQFSTRLITIITDDGMKEGDYIFGIRAVTEAVRAGKKIERLVVKSGTQGALLRQLTDEARKAGVPVQFAPAERLNRITRKNHQGVVAWLSAIEFGNIEALLPSLYESGKTPLIMVLDRITDVRNFGAIVRSADCMGADAIVMADRGVARTGGDAVKTSAGSLLHFPVCRTANMVKTIKLLKESGLKIAAASEKGGEDAFASDMSGPLAIVMGSEEKGVSADILAMCDTRVRIPMSGTTASLNVSVAAGILLYEATRQRLPER